MRHLVSGRKLSRRKSHRTAMLANLAASLIKHGRVKTTDAKAKEVRPFVERMVSFAKRGDLHARRIVLSRLKDSDAVKKLFDEIGPRYTNRFGGYTRILKLGFRQGDNSPVSLIEFVEEEIEKKSPVKSKAKKKKTPKKTTIAAEKMAEVVEAETAEKVVEVETAEEVVEVEIAEEVVEAKAAEEVVEAETPASDEVAAETSQVEAEEAVSEEAGDAEGVEEKTSPVPEESAAGKSEKDAGE